MTTGVDVDHEIILQYVQTLGFPICVSVALAWALWKIGGKLLESFFVHLAEINPKLDSIATSNEAIRKSNEKIENRVSNWPSDPVKTISDSVKEKILQDLAKAGCKLSDKEVQMLLQHKKA